MNQLWFQKSIVVLLDNAATTAPTVSALKSLKSMLTKAISFAAAGMGNQNLSWPNLNASPAKWVDLLEMLSDRRAANLVKFLLHEPASANVANDAIAAFFNWQLDDFGGWRDPQTVAQLRIIPQECPNISAFARAPMALRELQAIEETMAKSYIALQQGCGATEREAMLEERERMLNERAKELNDNATQYQELLDKRQENLEKCQDLLDSEWAAMHETAEREHQRVMAKYQALLAAGKILMADKHKVARRWYELAAISDETATQCLDALENDEFDEPGEAEIALVQAGRALGLDAPTWEHL